MKVAAQHINPDIETINVQALQKLRHYDFPGNVRELGNIIERAVNIATTNEIMPDDIVFDTGRAIPVNKLPTEILPENLDEAVAQAERNILARAMKKYKTSRKLGMALGVSHTSILRKMKKYGLSFGR